MKILILMPLDEKTTYMGMGIYKNLPYDVKEHTFCMPAFMDYLVNTKVAPSYEYALFDSLLSAQKIYDATEGEDLIVIGNMPKKYKFDAVFNFQDLVEDLPYDDKFLEKMITLVSEDENLSKMVYDMYTNEDSKMALHNCVATADFITAYLSTDPHLEDIKKDYEKRLAELKEKTHGELN